MRPLNKDEVRLIKIVRNDPFTLSMEHFPLYGVPLYTALSYAWGSQRDTEDLECEGKILKISPTVRQFFDQLQDGPFPDAIDHPTIVSNKRDIQYLWIDAICINQMDDPEKSAQVRLMTEIYAQAAETIIWLGDKSPGDEMALRFVEYETKFGIRDKKPGAVRRFMNLFLQF